MGQPESVRLNTIIKVVLKKTLPINRVVCYMNIRIHATLDIFISIYLSYLSTANHTYYKNTQKSKNFDIKVSFLLSISST
jgi:hypothetical protein